MIGAAAGYCAGSAATNDFFALPGIAAGMIHGRNPGWVSPWSIVLDNFGVEVSRLPGGNLNDDGYHNVVELLITREK